jgi:hypothetical protein
MFWRSFSNSGLDARWADSVQLRYNSPATNLRFTGRAQAPGLFVFCNHVTRVWQALLCVFAISPRSREAVRPNDPGKRSGAEEKSRKRNPKHSMQKTRAVPRWDCPHISMESMRGISERNSASGRLRSTSDTEPAGRFRRLAARWPGA